MYQDKPIFGLQIIPIIFSNNIPTFFWNAPIFQEHWDILSSYVISWQNTVKVW